MSAMSQAQSTVPKFASFRRKEVRALKDPERENESERLDVPDAAPFSAGSSDRPTPHHGHNRDRDRKEDPDDRRHSSQTSRHTEIHRPSKDRSGHRRERSRERSRRSLSPEDRHYKPSHRRRSPRRRSRSPRDRASRDARALPSSDKPPQDAASSENAPLFVIDKRGDPLIVRYGSNDRSRVPTYRRGGRGRVLGASGQFLFTEHEGSREVFDLQNSHEGKENSGSLFREKKRTALLPLPAQEAPLGRTRANRVYGKRDAEEQGRREGVNEDFLPLKGTDSQKRKRSRGDDSGDVAFSSDEGGRRYLLDPIGLRSENRDGFSDSDISSAEEELSGGEDRNNDSNEIKKEYIELSRRVKEHPEDVQSWLRLIKIQDMRLQLGGDKGSFDLDLDHDLEGEDAASRNKSLADVKLTMFESALPHARSETGRERLLLGLMREGSKVWSPKTLAKRWATISKEHPTSFSLWKACLDHDMASVSTFKFNDVKDFFTQRIRFLKALLLSTEGRTSAAAAPSSEGQPDMQAICDQFIYVFLRATRFLKDAGYAELAVASWQAMLELTFCRPAEFSSSAADADVAACLDSFKDFWESEAARFGEDGSKGWRRFAETTENDEFPEPKPAAVPSKPPDTRDPYRVWTALEQDRSRQSQMPARTLDEGAEDDPFRIVMFSDIEDLLLVFPASILARIKAFLIEALLIFCGLPPAFERVILDDDHPLAHARDDPFLAGSNVQLEEDACRKSDVALDSAVQRQEDKQPKFLQDHSRMTISADILFASPATWFPYLPQPPIKGDLEGTEGVYQWIISTAKQLTLSLGVEELAGYYLALQWQRDPQSAKKAAKSLLKQYPANVGLYQAYAHAEFTNGSSDLAKKALVSATSQKLNRADPTQAQALWNSLAWIELEEGAVAEGARLGEHAVACLCASVDDGNDASDGSEQQHRDLSLPVTQAQLLRARQKLRNARDYQLSSGNVDSAARFAESFALLEYLTNNDDETGSDAEPKSDKQGNIAPCIHSVLSFSAELSSRGSAASSPAHERLLQFASKLLYFHVRRGPFRPKFVREQLLHFVKLFPTNTMFLSLFVWSHSGGGPRLDDPVQDTLRRFVLSSGSSGSSSSTGGNTAARVFAIRQELLPNQGGNAHSARAAFERAIHAAEHNARLWISYVRFCQARKKELTPRRQQQKGLKGERGNNGSKSVVGGEGAPPGRDVFFRALAACPWSRDVVLEAFGDTLVRDMETEELLAVYSTMAARGLRVHIELEEFVEAWRRKQAKKTAP